MAVPRRVAWIVAMLLGVALFAPLASAWEIDATGVVYHVVDGDTIDVDTVGRVRLADVNAPEVGQPGFQQAKDFLNATVGDKEVYLDIDNVYRTDIYGRTVCVVYVRHNDTYLLNLNEALLEAHLAVLDDFENEFNPSAWTLYVDYPVGGAPPSDGPQASGQGILGSPWFWSAVVGIAVVIGFAAISTTRRGKRGRGR